MADAEEISGSVIFPSGSYSIQVTISPKERGSFLREETFAGRFNYNASTLALDGKLENSHGVAEISGEMQPESLEIMVTYLGLGDPLVLMLRKKRDCWEGDYKSNLNSGKAIGTTKFLSRELIEFDELDFKEE